MIARHETYSRRLKPPYKIAASKTAPTIVAAVLIVAATTTSAALAADAHQAAAEPFKHNEAERSSEFWLEAGRQALSKALEYRANENVARNAILFVGDGMSLPTLTAARIFQGQMDGLSGEEGLLSFEALPNVALLKTYNVDQQIPDSAATATAMFSGVKANFYTLGVNARVKLNETNCAFVGENKVRSILEHAMNAGKSTGLVTNTRITHATPAAAYAHIANRRWECVAPTGGPQCKDIAAQLVENEPGKRLNVVLGGGRRCFFGASKADVGAGRQPGLRADDKDLVEAWLDERRATQASAASSASAANFAYVNSSRTLREVNYENTDYLLGLFAYSHMSFEELRDRSDDGEPSLTEMTLSALRVLRKNPNGYVLIVESGRIDHSHHENIASVALRETVALAWAVNKTLEAIDERDTLVAVTADHAHALTINGLAPRGNPILGLSKLTEHNSALPYTTLVYGNGPGHHSPRRNPAVGPNSTDSPYYVQYAAIAQEEAFHDGSDVGVFARGPFAHLFQGVQEQSYVAHVLSYALCIGEYVSSPHCTHAVRAISGADETSPPPQQQQTRLAAAAAAASSRNQSWRAKASSAGAAPATPWLALLFTSLATATLLSVLSAAKPRGCVTAAGAATTAAQHLRASLI